MRAQDIEREVTQRQSRGELQSLNTSFFRGKLGRALGFALTACAALASNRASAGDGATNSGSSSGFLTGENTTSLLTPAPSPFEAQPGMLGIDTSLTPGGTSSSSSPGTRESLNFGGWDLSQESLLGVNYTEEFQQYKDWSNAMLSSSTGKFDTFFDIPDSPWDSQFEVSLDPNSYNFDGLNPSENFQNQLKCDARKEKWKYTLKDPSYESNLMDVTRQNTGSMFRELHEDYNSFCKGWGYAIGGGSIYSLAKNGITPLTAVGASCKIADIIPPQASENIAYEDVFKFPQGSIEVRDIFAGAISGTMPTPEPATPCTPKELELSNHISNDWEWVEAMIDQQNKIDDSKELNWP